MNTIRALYANGVFQPLDPVVIPEGSQVEFEPRLVTEPCEVKHRKRVHELLSQSYETGIPDLAARHDEHQP
jgi:predicted DNA-binding antitoxin AbrB/MazE fold protein